jgi:diacylglycerol kinase family enzyme
MRVLVILNAKAGTLVSSDDQDQATIIRDRFATHGIDAEVRDVPGDQLAKTTCEARDSGRFDLIIAGGGDGTLNTIAGALVGGSVPFGVLPLGTFNHLAKELQIPLDLEAAVDALATGRDVPFNLGEVNGQVFLLFAAIGLYSDMVKHRDAQRKTLGRPKMFAGAIALVKVLFRWPLMRVHFARVMPADVQAPALRLTSVVYVSLSEYQMNALGMKEVPADPRGALNVLVLRHIHRRGLIWQAIKGLFGRLTAGHDLELLRIDAIEITPRGRDSIRVGYDGEVESMETPLKFRVIRDGLRVRIPNSPPS